MKSQKAKVISLNIDLVSYQDALNRIIDAAKQKQNGYVCFANAHMTIEANDNNEYADFVNKASLVLADGMPIVKCLRLLYGFRQERIAGMDVFPDLLRRAGDLRLNVFLFGTTDELLEKIAERINLQFPEVNVVGMFSPPFGQSLDSPEYVNLINASQADLVFVALGCPKQEMWMAKHYGNINSVLLGVGGAFPVFAGVAKRAPLLMQKYALEWLYRLLQEPKRLLWRYLRTNTKFLFLVALEKLKMLFKLKSSQ